MEDLPSKIKFPSKHDFLELKRRSS